jgi:hypothetical protein
MSDSETLEFDNDALEVENDNDNENDNEDDDSSSSEDLEESDLSSDDDVDYDAEEEVSTFEDVKTGKKKLHKKKGPSKSQIINRNFVIPKNMDLDVDYSYCTTVDKWKKKSTDVSEYNTERLLSEHENHINENFEKDRKLKCSLTGISNKIMRGIIKLVDKNYLIKDIDKIKIPKFIIELYKEGILDIIFSYEKILLKYNVCLEKKTISSKTVIKCLNNILESVDKKIILRSYEYDKKLDDEDKYYYIKYI